MPFSDRSDAGRWLAVALEKYLDQRPVVLALPRGGVPVAAEVAKALHAPLDLLLVRKIGVPFQPELAMDAVSDGSEPLIVRNEEVIRLAGARESEFVEICRRELAEVERRCRTYVGHRASVAVPGRTAIVVDDGVAAGATVRAALRAIRHRRSHMRVLAVPVAPTDALDDLRVNADDAVCLEDYRDFAAIGQFYRDFRQIADQEVIGTLRSCSPTTARSSEPGAGGKRP